jgi:protein TonB
MSTMSINTFPAINTLQSPRSWFLAIIVLLHVGFFIALNSGLSFSTLVFQPPPFKVSMIDRPERAPPITRTVVEPDPRTWPREEVDPGPLPPLQFGSNEEPPPRSDPTESGPLPYRGEVAPQSKIVAPALPSTGLSEPPYPASEIRAGHTGTTVLSLEILPSGRVGNVRLVRSSGYLKLDQSALREAHKWRFIPGTRDGVPVTLWKQLPVTFELDNRK